MANARDKPGDENLPYTVCRILSLLISGANAWCQSASRAKTSSPALTV